MVCSSIGVDMVGFESHKRQECMIVIDCIYTQHVYRILLLRLGDGPFIRSSSVADTKYYTDSTAIR